MDRRGFIGSILALGVAPAIVRADSLMRIVPRDLVIAYDLKPRDSPFDSYEEWMWEDSMLTPRGFTGCVGGVNYINGLVWPVNVGTNSDCAQSRNALR